MTVESKPKMVVGRHALQKLAESAVVPAPHLSFGKSSRAVVHPTDNQQTDVAQSRAAVAGDVPEIVSVGTRAAVEHRVSERTPGSADTKSSQYRLDPAAATVTNAQRSSNAEGPPMITRSSAPMPRPTVSASPTTALKPLSSYRTEQVQEAPIASLEVDSLAWPPACRLLIERGDQELESAASMLAGQIDGGSQTIAVCSIDEGQGCTTVVLCVALKLAAQGLRVCLVDGNVTHPQLAETVCLEPELGLESILAGEATLNEVLIESLEDRITLLPLCKPLRGDTIERSKLRQTVTFGELRDQFDVVLVDAGCVGSPAARASILEAGSIDAAILVGCASEERIAWQRARQALEKWNVPCWGAIENRCAS
jgi:Mrp family chromosome partitioning ATPase